MVILKQENQIANRFLSASRKHFVGKASPHIHDFFEMEYIIEGKGHCMIDGRTYPMTAGSLFLLTPANTHAVYDADADMINVMFKCDHTDPAFSLPFLYAPSSHRFCMQDADRILMAAQLTELTRVYEQQTDYARTLLSCVMQKLACAPRADTDGGLLPSLQRSLLYITENFRSGVTLESTAAHLGLCPTYLSELFSRQLGMTFQAYLDRVRFSCAQNLLALTDLPVCVVHEYAGFRDYANFSRRFKQRYGTTPGNYRKQTISPKTV